MSVNPSSKSRLPARTTSVNNTTGLKPKASRMTPTMKEATISRRATIAGDPPVNRPVMLVMGGNLERAAVRSDPITPVIPHPRPEERRRRVSKDEDFGVRRAAASRLRKLHDRRRLRLRSFVRLAADRLAVHGQFAARGADPDGRPVANLAREQ